MLSKASNRMNITLILNLVAYYYMTHTPFNIIDLLICYIDNIFIVCDPKVKNKQNLALSHVIAYILQTKYALGNLKQPNHHPSLFSNHSFHTLFGGKKHKQMVKEEKEEEISIL